MAQPLQQIHVVLSEVGYKSTASTNEGMATYRLEQQIHESSLLRLCPTEKWHRGSYTAGCPRPVLVTKQHQQQLAELHQALVLAITDIVQRWWTDTAAQFPKRMPLEREEEDLLLWMEGQIPHSIPRFQDALGSWRPDFLIKEDQETEAGYPREVFCITEINARFCFNGFLHAAFGQQALLDIGIERLGLDGATDPAKILQGLCRLFCPDRPLHLLKGQEPGIDIHMFVDFLRCRFGLRPRIIAPGDLRLVIDDQAPYGYTLCCLVPAPEFRSESSNIPLIFNDGETLEEIHQIGLELHQRELLALPTAILRHISLRCFNDLRTILLVHDKRMLGIVRQELDSLVCRSVLSQAQANVLRKGIAETLLPGSTGIQELLQRSEESPELRKDYILKPIRGGKGAGILFGDELSDADWVSHLQRLKCPELVSGRTNFVVQRHVKQRSYDVILGTSEKHVHYPLVGTYHVVHGELLGLGTWRSSPGRIVAVSNGGSWICSLILQDGLSC